MDALALQQLYGTDGCLQVPTAVRVDHKRTLGADGTPDELQPLDVCLQWQTARLDLEWGSGGSVGW